MANYEGNEHIRKRLHGIQQMLMAVHSASNAFSNESRGAEREAFINLFLSNMLPPQFRFGSGDITDLGNNRSGQLDLVIEYPILPSINVPSTGSNTRLYLAEGVASVIEVKSNLSAQWGEVQSTSDKLKKLKRRVEAGASGVAPRHIPLFAVGYEGWSTLNTVRRHVYEEDVVDGILIINPPLCVWKPSLASLLHLTADVEGMWALWGFITAIQKIALALKNLEFDLTYYARPDLFVLKQLCFMEERAGSNESAPPFNLLEFMSLENFEKSFLLDIVAFLEQESLIEISERFTEVQQSQDNDSQTTAPYIYAKVTDQGKDAVQDMVLPV